MGISDDELDMMNWMWNEGGGSKRSLYTESCGERTDLNVFEWRTKRQLIRILVDRNTYVGSEKKFCS